MNSLTESTFVTAEMTSGLGELRFCHPPGTFALTPASLISLQAIGQHQNLLSGLGLDWGSGTGCLSIAAARISEVRKVVGLEISEANVSAARENALRNEVANKVSFFLSDSYSPKDPVERKRLESLTGQVNFILSNPPSSEGDDGFGYRRVVLQGARGYLMNDGVVFLSISSQYGQTRVERLCQDVPGFVYRGILSSTDWVPFNLSRPDLLHCLHLYSEEEGRGGLEYVFQDSQEDQQITARAALACYDRTGTSPLSKWQTHHFVFRSA